jgi:hypothetical protein
MSEKSQAAGLQWTLDSEHYGWKWPWLISACFTGFMKGLGTDKTVPQVTISDLRGEIITQVIRNEEGQPLYHWNILGGQLCHWDFTGNFTT